MARKSGPSAETKFLRGDTGVDGAATVEKASAEETEASKAKEALYRGRTWLGREALTWLLFKSEGGEPLTQVEGKPLSVLFTGKLTLRAASGDVTEASLKGVSAPYSRLTRLALAQGLLVHGARLQLTHGEQSFEVSLDAEHFAVGSGKLPALLKEEGDDPLTERLEYSTRLSGLLDALLTAFMKVRTGKGWGAEVQALLEWRAQDPKAP
jgi:hypothetical protein